MHGQQQQRQWVIYRTFFLGWLPIHPSPPSTWEWDPPSLSLLYSFPLYGVKFAAAPNFAQSRDVNFSPWSAFPLLSQTSPLQYVSDIRPDFQRPSGAHSGAFTQLWCIFDLFHRPFFKPNCWQELQKANITTHDIMTERTPLSVMPCLFIVAQYPISTASTCGLAGLCAPDSLWRRCW